MRREYVDPVIPVVFLVARVLPPRVAPRRAARHSVAGVPPLRFLCLLEPSPLLPPLLPPQPAGLADLLHGVPDEPLVRLGGLHHEGPLLEARVDVGEVPDLGREAAVVPLG